MSSVWVCFYREGTPRRYGSSKECGCIIDGKCTTTGKPCDAVEYAPVVRGKWELYQPNACFLAKYRCSVCKEEHRDPSEKYCPNCGAKMSGEEFN